MKATLNLTLVCLAIMGGILINSCRKDDFVVPKQDSLSLLEKSKAFFESDVRQLHGNKISSTTSAAKDIRRLVPRKPLWNEAAIKKLTIGSAVVVPLTYDTTLYTKRGKSNQALSINNISYLLMYPGMNGGMNAELVTWIPSDDWWDVGRKESKPFQGQILIEDWGGKFIKGYQFEPDGRVQSLVKGNTVVKGAQTYDARCDIIDWYTCWDVYGDSGCRYDYSEVVCAGGGSAGGDAGWKPGGAGSGDSGGGGGSPAPTDYSPDPRTIPCGDSGQSSTNTSKVPIGCDDYPEEVPGNEFELTSYYLPGRGDPIVQDVKKYMDCFGNEHTELSNYSLTVYVQEPDYNLEGSSGLVNGVGHATVGITKDGITQIIGFYPSGAPFSVLTNQPVVGELRDNGTGAFQYTVSATFEVSSVDFTELTNYLTNFSGSTYPYNVYSQNCADFVINACEKAGVVLPNNNTSGPVQRSPKQLGDDLRKQKVDTGATNINTSSGNAPVSKGPC